jgi:hypothetical protein
MCDKFPLAHTHSQVLNGGARTRKAHLTQPLNAAYPAAAKLIIWDERETTGAAVQYVSLQRKHHSPNSFLTTILIHRTRAGARRAKNNTLSLVPCAGKWQKCTNAVRLVSLRCVIYGRSSIILCSVICPKSTGAAAWSARRQWIYGAGEINFLVFGQMEKVPILLITWESRSLGERWAEKLWVAQQMTAGKDFSLRREIEGDRA